MDVPVFVYVQAGSWEFSTGREVQADISIYLEVLRK